MILERLFIQNYKQFRDPIELFPPEGAIGVVGANGAGKSTLFESILWAFFGSRGGGPRFANESIPWSGGTTKDLSVVEVTLATDGGSYTVRRQLKGGSTSAEVRDGEGRTIVTGTSDVIRWVEETLLGMDRTAFEATFYARQKELRFFANDDGISRVRRISKLLGIGGVEAAQALLREDRNALRSEARVLEKRLDEADLESFQSELKEAREACDRLEGELEKVSAELGSAEEELKSARAARVSLEASYRKHSQLVGDLRAAEAEGRRAADRVSEGEKDLADLAAAEEELGRLKPLTARLPEVAAELEKLDEDRRLAEERERGRRECLQGQRRVSDIEGEVWNVLEELDGGDEEVVPGFNALFDLDGTELLGRSVTVLEGASGELEKAEAHHEELRGLSSRHEAYRAAEEEVRKARVRHEEATEEARGLREELEDLSGGEDPEKREEELRGDEERLKELAALHRGRANAHEREAKNVDRAREAIDSGAEDHCPTCHRGFDGGEQEEISDTLKRQAASLRRQATAETEEAEKHTGSARETAEKLQKLRTRVDRWRSLRESLVRAEDRAADRLTTLEELDKELAERGAGIEGTKAPTEEDLREARVRRERLRSVRDAHPAVASLAAEHSRLTGRVSELLTRLEELSDLSYDAEAHREKSAERDRLERARGRVEELGRRLESRSGVEEALKDARTRVDEAGEVAKKLREEVSALGFDEAAYEAATEKVAGAEVRVSDLRDAREGLGGDWKDADHRIERAKTELKRLDDDRKLANEKAAAAARMDEMDGLFTEFFRSLTARARPMLEAEASGLVRELTDNRYESMEFDENYRVRLLDRFDDSYAIERFSGGEADVASLSARVALSRLIAARGGNTLGFLVLDEVFGSLDAGRRNNVLLAVERLKRSFGQIFIISHVGEVQESALVDEIWQIEEDEEGKSLVRRMDAPLGGTPEPLLEAGVLDHDVGPG